MYQLATFIAIIIVVLCAVTVYKTVTSENYTVVANLDGTPVYLYDTRNPFVPRTAMQFRNTFAKRPVTPFYDPFVM